MATEYRKVCIGSWWFLEYKKTATVGFWIFKKEVDVWKRVPRVYYDKIYGRTLDSLGDHCNITHFDDIENFVKKWPDVNEYLVHFYREQTRLEEEANEIRMKNNKDNGKIINL